MNVAVHETEAQVLYDVPNEGVRSSCEETILRFSGAKIPLRRFEPGISVVRCCFRYGTCPACFNAGIYSSEVRALS